MRQGSRTKARKVSTATPSIADLRKRLDARSRELKEAREQQTATAEVLQIINSSQGDLAPVFDGILQRAIRLCEAAFGNLWLYDGEKFDLAAAQGPFPSSCLEMLSQAGQHAGPHTAMCRAVLTQQTIQIADYQLEQAYLDRDPVAVATAEVGNARTILAVPMVGEPRALGVFFVHRQEVRSFSKRQVTLLQNFAAQAVMAMENARLLTETREALEQQTATAEVLQIINSSPGDLTPVWDAMLEKALSLCEANFGLLCSFDGEAQILLASRGMSPELVEMAGRVPIEPTSSVGRLARNKDHFIHIPDITDDPVYRSGVPSRRLFVEATGARTALWVALRKDGVLIGVFIVYRTDVRPFADKQIALLQSFAAQAVVAMENARLITETREALEQQTATAEVLGVINSSPGDLRPVFETMLEKAMQLCEAHFGAFFSFDGEVFHLAAERGSPAAGVAALREPLPGKGALEELIKGEDIVHVPDVADSEAYRGGVRGRRLLVDLFGARTALWVALRRDEALFGYFCIYRKEVRPFTEKQIALLQNFAAQAVIAMENTRLLAETREALRAQQATAEVMQVINASSGDLAPVFQAMLDKAMALCGAEIGGLGTWWGDRFSFVAALGVSKPFTDFIANNEVSPRAPQRLSAGRPRQGLCPVRGPRSLASLCGGRSAEPRGRRSRWRRTTSTVPLVRDDEVLGVICAVRREVRAVLRRPDRAPQELRRPGRGGDGERTPPDRDARGPGATDGNCRNFGCHQFLAGQPRAGVRRNARQGDATLRSIIRRLRAL